MSTAPRFLMKLFQRWRAAGQEREVLLTLLNKPDDHLLRDAGMTREEVTNIVCRYRLEDDAVPDTSRWQPVKSGIVNTTNGNETTGVVRTPASMMDGSISPIFDDVSIRH
ncbi:hypothetical protein [Phyllobacterium zundukense]|uniref:Uncharacterized protein n=1 Tax=Phyllobacterium zundukense TaxID=1867719 RepID=A0A2N9VQX0_9HYPH|nr:hypothetical protein [Phyllobacterium zundukense]ATU92323.1 hypothetical protein BLM14_12265 [Phyllobacterium zundukense]PIO41888.1 hypothetical protein B5P45_22710 [Phyllobacterium zundukense]